jgi:hypothetical protein
MNAAPKGQFTRFGILATRQTNYVVVGFVPNDYVGGNLPSFRLLRMSIELEID